MINLNEILTLTKTLRRKVVLLGLCLVYYVWYDIPPIFGYDNPLFRATSSINQYNRLHILESLYQPQKQRKIPWIRENKLFFKFSDQENDNDSMLQILRHLDPYCFSPLKTPWIPTAYSIGPVTTDELLAVAKLRVSVFYPQYIAAFNFQTRIKEKLRARVEIHGSICFCARLNDLNQYPGDSVDNDMHLAYIGNIIGTIEVSPNDFFGTPMESYGASRKLYAADLAVREDCRRKGIATQLLREVETFATVHGFREIYLHVEIDNLAARRMYEKLGYEEIPMSDVVRSFTEGRLQKPPELFVLLCKVVDG